MNRQAGITLDGVTRHYATPAGPVRALDGITLGIDAGASVAVTGPSGCGKSTLLGLLAGLERPTAGRVVVGGEELSALSERARARLRRRHLGLVFQADNLLPFLTAVENVAQQVRLAGAHHEAVDDGRPGRILSELGMADALDKVPDQLSGGQRQRVAVARAVAHRPWVILADEPTGSLDAAHAGAILDLLLSAQEETGATLVVATHDPAVAGRLDRALELRDGRLLGAA